MNCLLHISLFGRFRRALLTVLFSLLAVGSFAVETVLVGNVHDAATGAPLPNVNLYFRGSKIGTTTDENGFFFMRLDVNAKVRLVVSLVGYKKQYYDILPGQSAGMELLLEEKTNELETVVALPGSNPALPLMAAVRAHRRENDLALPLPSSASYFISDIQPRHLRRRLWKSLEGGMVQQTDSSYLLPLPADGFAQYMIPLPERFSFYDSNIPLGETSFLSPLAASANSFYNFYLLDSAVVSYDGLREKHYRIHFLPKNSFNPTLSGILEIDSSTYALREVRASVPREVNVNFLTDLRYDASYAPSGKLTREDLSALLEIAVKSDTSHFFPSLLASRRSLGEVASRPDTLLALDTAYTAYLRNRAPEAVCLPDDSLLRAVQDSLLERPLFRIARWTALTFYTGYMPTGTALDIGRIHEVFSLNPVEKVHMALPFRTNARMSERFSLEGFLGYGIRDRGVKYRFGFNAMLPAERRQMFSVFVSDRYAVQDVSAFGALRLENCIGDDNLAFTNRLFNGLTNRTYTFSPLARRREAQISLESDWCESEGAAPAVETRFSVQFGHQGYGDPLLYRFYDMPSYRYASLRGMLRLGWQEKVADFYMQRKHLYSRFPTVYLGAEMGSYTLEGAPSYRIYGLLNLMVRQDVPLGMGGQLTYLVEGGVVLGKVPYPLLSVMSGNSGYTYSSERFTLMNNYQYAADRYILAHLHWDGKGILFNQIPGVRYARLHELVEMKIAYGALSDKHRSVIDYKALFGDNMMRPLTVPYVEMGVGLGNILRVADVYSIWRLTARDDLSAARWAIRFRFHLSL